jgi:hypothetical protein
MRDKVSPEPRMFYGEEGGPTFVVRRPEWPIVQPPPGWTEDSTQIAEPAKPHVVAPVPQPSKPKKSFALSDQLFAKLEKRVQYTFAPAAVKALGLLKRRKWPAKLIEFYAAHEPQYVGQDSLVSLRLFSIAEILFEMKAMEPSATLAPLGYAPLASDGFGNQYLYDLKSIGPDGYPAIVFANHEQFYGIESREETAEMLGPTADSLPEFLWLAADGKLDEQLGE